LRIARRPSAADGFAIVVDPFTLACTRPFIRPAMHSTPSAEAFAVALTTDAHYRKAGFTLV
jgi:hypothetical protein